MGAGPGAVLGNTTVPFIGGLATFNNIFIDSIGDGYQLEFSISYPTGSSVNTTHSNSFSVGGRPLGLRINPFGILQPQNSSFAVNASIWDETLDQEAAPEVLVDDFECSATFNNGNFSGTTTVTVSAGESLVVFDDLLIEEMTLNNLLTIDCFGNSTSTSLQTVVTTSFTYSGNLGNVLDLIEAFQPSMGTISCDGCPKGGADTSGFKPSWLPF